MVYLVNEGLMATIDGAVFRTYNGPQDPQFIFDEEGLNDFWDSATVRRDDTAYPNGWGDFREPSRRGSVTFSLSGAARARDPRELYALRDQLMGICNDGTYKEFVVRSETGIRRTRTVTLDGSPKWVQKTDTAALFKISFYSPSPYLYGDTKTVDLGQGILAGGLSMPIAYPMDYGNPIVPEIVTLENEGNTHAWPTFVVTGSFPSGFIITDNLGNQVVYNGLITHASPVVINMEKGQATQGGNDRSTLLGRRDWFSIPPRGSIRATFTPLQQGQGWCTATFRDTWT